MPRNNSSDNDHLRISIFHFRLHLRLGGKKNLRHDITQREIKNLGGNESLIEDTSRVLNGLLSLPVAPKDSGQEFRGRGDSVIAPV